ncbi:MAG TPA: hypothetical protein VG097_08160 [Gemmata sp.]|jgi:uncharacterized protein YlzI (FlbEa/FlbD family)|nr:hypothetical protein [Gemmata sp.]
MPKFKKFNQQVGRPVYVIPDEICSVEMAAIGTRITMKNGKHFDINEPLEEVVQMLDPQKSAGAPTHFGQDAKPMNLGQNQ